MNKKLFAFDLDGTLLSNSKDSIVPEQVKKIIQQLKKDGHIVCLFTGRPWRATKKVYEDLKLDTIVVNYNGAHIHNPKNYNFIPTTKRIRTSNVMRVLETNKIKMIANNKAIEGPSYIHIMNFNKSHFVSTFIKTDKNTKIITPIQYHKMPTDPTGILIEIKKEYAKNIKKIKDFFMAKYGDLGEFTYWETGKDNLPILELTNPLARKDIALISVARYYDINMSDTIAFGDGFNDVQMLKTAGIGVAMANASNVVKSFANVISRYTNKNDGVAKFIKWYFKKGYKSVDKTIYSIGKPFIEQVEQD